MKVPSIFNFLARSFLVFLLGWLWVGYYVRAVWAVFLLSIGITAAVNTLFWWFGKRKGVKVTLSREKRAHKDRVLLQLRFNSLPKTLELFKTAFIQQHEVKKLAKKLSFDNINFFTLFHKEVTIAEVIGAINATATGAATWIAAQAFPPHVFAFVRRLNLDVHLVDGEQAYEILEKHQTFPELTVEITTKKRLTLRELNNLVFSRVKFKNYVIMGTIILFTSFIVRFNIYYIIIATFVFGFALASLVIKPQRKIDKF